MNCVALNKVKADYSLYEIDNLSVSQRDKHLLSRFSLHVLFLVVEDFVTYQRLYRMRNTAAFLSLRCRAYISFDPLSQEFTWIRNKSNVYVLKGDNVSLGIVSINEDRYRVILASENRNQTISDDLNFEYSFAAEDFACSNRGDLFVGDREVKWRNIPSSKKQIALVRSKRYRADLDKLTRGQASYIIASGTFRGTG